MSAPRVSVPKKAEAPKSAPKKAAAPKQTDSPSKAPKKAEAPPKKAPKKALPKASSKLSTEESVEVESQDSSGPKRHRVVYRDNVHGLTNRRFRILGYRAGVYSMGSETYGRLRRLVTEFLKMILKDAISFATSAKRKTILVKDVNKALEVNGIRAINNTA